MRFPSMWRKAILVAMLATARAASGHPTVTTKLTWSREIARIVYSRCLACHRENGRAFSLSTYAEARPWAMAIKEEVLMRRMPPWNAVKGFGRFKNDIGLTQEELSLIADWVEGGAPEGDPMLMPLPPAAVAYSKIPPAREIAFSGTTILDKKVQAIGIRVGNIPSSGTLQVIAVRPDGRVEPLVWVRQRSLADPGEYWFQSTISLPARTELQAVPGGSASLLVR
jgi:hypothetical protein